VGDCPYDKEKTLEEALSLNRNVELRQLMRGYILVIFMLIIGAATAAKITVVPAGEEFPLIQKAVDNTGAGDTIEVHSGTYAEHVYLSKAV
jgi:hypothetical protein